VQSWLKRRIPGPTEAERQTGRCLLWGEAADETGRNAATRLQTPDGYDLTVTVIAKEAGRHVFFHAGASSVLLAFIADTTLKGDQLPPHGAKGPSHFALGIESAALDAWRQKLQENGIAIEHEVEWPRGGKSIYFRDPAGNLVELITPGVWGLPSGW
jgi:catechol 2,3-dioxygenase-like lactoylglutathione lyase family enzyme